MNQLSSSSIGTTLLDSRRNNSPRRTRVVISKNWAAINSLLCSKNRWMSPLNLCKSPTSTNQILAVLVLTSPKVEHFAPKKIWPNLPQSETCKLLVFRSHHFVSTLEFDVKLHHGHSFLPDKMPPTCLSIVLLGTAAGLVEVVWQQKDWKFWWWKSVRYWKI